MAVVRLSDLSEEERKKYLQSLSDEANLGRQREQEDLQRGNELFNQNSDNNKNNESNSVFKASDYLDDGYQLGDVTKTAITTAGNLANNVVKGVAKTGEGIADFISYRIADVADLTGKDDFANRVRENASKDSWEEELGGQIDRETDKGTIFGEKAQGIAQGLGQVGINTALGIATGGGALGNIVTGANTLFGSAGGSESDAYNEQYQKALDEGVATSFKDFLQKDKNSEVVNNARTFGLIAGTAEEASELMFGGLGKATNILGYGKGLTDFDDQLAKKITSKFTNEIAKNTTQLMVKSGGEGLEEVLSGLGSAVGKKLTYEKDEDLKKLVKNEDLLDQFIAGAVTSAFAQAPSAIRATRSGQDLITGRTSEQDAEYNEEEADYQKTKTIQQRENDLIKEYQKQGKEFTSQDRENIITDLSRQYDNGEIKPVKLTRDDYAKIEVVINPNADSKKALQNIMVHELTHDLENTKDYETLQGIVKDYTKRQSGYEDSRKALEDMYSNVYKNKSPDEFKKISG